MRIHAAFRATKTRDYTAGKLLVTKLAPHTPIIRLYKGFLGVTDRIHKAFSATYKHEFCKTMITNTLACGSVFNVPWLPVKAPKNR